MQFQFPLRDDDAAAEQRILRNGGDDALTRGRHRFPCLRGQIHAAVHTPIPHRFGIDGVVPAESLGNLAADGISQRLRRFRRVSLRGFRLRLLRFLRLSIGRLGLLLRLGCG